MKTQKFNATQSLFILSFILLLFTNACADSDKNSNSDPSTNTETSIVRPEMDLNTAVLYGNLDVVKQHIKAHTNFNEKEAMSGSTPLVTAASFGKIDIAMALIEAGADLSIKNNDGSTALHSAAFFCHVEIVQLLIDAKADKTIKNNFGATPRETVMGPFAEIKPFYDMLKLQFEPLGMKIDLAEIEKTRPVIAMMLQ